MSENFKSKMHPKLFALLIKNEDGFWSRDDMPMTKKEAKRAESINRIIGGITTRIVDADDQEIQNWRIENGV